ncbi:MAG: 16S rRNA (cytidine(1402)-2'-O)-methyltransferase [bacterium]|nr:16S rRNA (cytidine(1402)-2'-O)-methyltransferase [bacterium]
MPAILEPKSEDSGKLILVPTPIGNLDDITLRAINVLKKVDWIVCEDTNHSKKLLAHFQISKPLLQYHEQGNYLKKLQQIVQRLHQGSTIALITSAGTPSISDPGYALIRECINQKIDVECLPGPTALIPALVVSGLPTNRFVFEGFLSPSKRKKRLLEIAQEFRTTIIYESPLRIHRLLNELIQLGLSSRKGCIIRELTKRFEEILRGSLLELLEQIQSRELKGELIVIIEGKEKE